MVMALAATVAVQAYAQSNTTSLVIFSVRTAAGSPQTRSLSLEAVVEPDDDGSNIFWGWGPGANTVPLTNGVAAVHLEPNDYTVTLAGAPGSFMITVPTNGMIYNAVNITTNLPGYLSASNGPATVIFPLLTMTGSAQTRMLGLAPIINPVQNGTNIVWGPALTATPTNGLATTHLEPNGYTVTMSGGKGALTIYVPTDGGTYNGASLPSTMPSPVTAPYYLVSGAGSATVNGNYTFNPSGVGGAILSAWTNATGVTLEYQYGKWTFINGYPFYFSESGATTNTAAGWIYDVVGGTAPGPTVTAFGF